MELLAVAKPEVSEWGRLRGRVREGRCIPLAGGPGAVPLGKLKKSRCMQVSLSAFFRQKVNTLIPAFIPVNFGKVSNPFEI
jgi:hypothetical protein